MYFLKLDTLETANELSKICDKYRDNMDVDVIYGRQTIDGRSVLGVVSLLGHIVKLVPVTKENITVNDFYNEVQKIGAYKV